MSITFFCPDAPTRTVVCEYKKDCEETNIPCRDNCNGTREESEAPECNFANDNAFDIMKLVGIPKEYFGKIELTDMPALQHRLLEVINRPSKRKHLIREPYMEHRYIDSGNTDEWTMQRLHALGDLVTYAQEHKVAFVWG